MQKTLVTGADGFIGSHLVETLVRNGHSVRAFVYYNSFNSWGWLDGLASDIKKEIDVFSGDIRDGNGVRVAMDGCDTVLHLAALIGIPYSYHSPSTYVETNVIGTLNVLQAARDLNVQNVVHTSTSEVYGTAQIVPIDEGHPLQAQSPYAATKISADQLALSFYRSFETPVTVLRPFNTYGPRQSARAVIPSIITQILNGASEIKLGAMSPTRDFNFVADTVSAFFAAAQDVAGVGEVVNVGSNFEISISDTVKVIAEVIGREVDVSTDQQRIRPKDSEVERLWADNTKCKKLYGWQPKFGGLIGFRNGIELTAEWFSDANNLAQYKSDIYNV